MSDMLKIESVFQVFEVPFKKASKSIVVYREVKEGEFLPERKFFFDDKGEMMQVKTYMEKNID